MCQFEKYPFALSVVSAANEVETPLPFDFGPIFFKDGAYAQGEWKFKLRHYPLVERAVRHEVAM